MMSHKPAGFHLHFGIAIWLLLSPYTFPPWHWAILVKRLELVSTELSPLRVTLS